MKGTCLGGVCLCLSPDLQNLAFLYGTNSMCSLSLYCFKALCSSGWDIAFRFLEFERERTHSVCVLSVFLMLTNAFTLTAASRVGCPLPVSQVSISGSGLSRSPQVAQLVSWGADLNPGNRLQNPCAALPLKGKFFRTYTGAQQTVL